jgi:hypothetical protein
MLFWSKERLWGDSETGAVNHVYAKGQRWADRQLDALCGEHVMVARRGRCHCFWTALQNTKISVASQTEKREHNLHIIFSSQHPQ